MKWKEELCGPNKKQDCNLREITKIVKDRLIGGGEGVFKDKILLQCQRKAHKHYIEKLTFVEVQDHI
jgi:hypothetical protein